MISIRTALREEFSFIGTMLVSVYSDIDGFPKPDEQPGYYQMLLNVGDLCAKPGTEIIVAVDEASNIAGAVVYFGDMKYYGSGGTATQEQNASGFRLLGVARHARAQGIGKRLTLECIKRAREKGQKTLVIHTTLAMMDAWKMYERLGFRRASDLDFTQSNLPVFGFRYDLEAAAV